MLRFLQELSEERYASGGVWWLLSKYQQSQPVRFLSPKRQWNIWCHWRHECCSWTCFQVHTAEERKGVRLQSQSWWLIESSADTGCSTTLVLLAIDTMHLYWSNGISSWEVVEIYNRWKQIYIGNLQQFVELDWRTTHQVCTPSWRKCLGRDWNFGGNTYKGTASNLMLFLPLFHYVLSRVLPPMNLLQKELQCFDVLRRITIELRKLQYCQTGFNIERYQDLQVVHQRLIVECYGDSFVKPKHHCRFHAAEQMQRIQFHVDCFATERKHKQYKSHIGLHRFDTWAQDGAKIPVWISPGTQCAPFYRGNWVPPYRCIQILTIKSGKNKNTRNTSL